MPICYSSLSFLMISLQDLSRLVVRAQRMILLQIHLFVSQMQPFLCFIAFISCLYNPIPAFYDTLLYMGNDAACTANDTCKENVKSALATNCNAYVSYLSSAVHPSLFPSLHHPSPSLIIATQGSKLSTSFIRDHPS